MVILIRLGGCWDASLCWARVSYCCISFCAVKLNSAKGRTEGLHFSINSVHTTSVRMTFYCFTTFIRKTCPCNEYSLKPHFYIAKLGFAGVYLFFLFLLQNIDCGYSLEPPRRGGSNVYPQSMFWAKIRKISKFFSGKFFIFYNFKNLFILHGHVFVIFDRCGIITSKELQLFT